MGRLYGHSLSGWLAAWLGIIAVVVAGASNLYWLSRRRGPSVAAPSPHQPSAAARPALPGGGAPLVRSMGSVGHHFRAAHPRVSDRHHGDCGDDGRSLPHLRTVGRCLHGDLGGGRNVAGCDARRDPGQRPLQTGARSTCLACRCPLSPSLSLWFASGAAGVSVALCQHEPMSEPATGRRLMVSTVDYHTAGEPFRIVSGGIPSLRGRTILEKRRYA